MVAAFEQCGLSAKLESAEVSGLLSVEVPQEGQDRREHGGEVILVPIRTHAPRVVHQETAFLGNEEDIVNCKHAANRNFVTAVSVTATGKRQEDVWEEVEPSREERCGCDRDLNRPEVEGPGHRRGHNP